MLQFLFKKKLSFLNRFHWAQIQFWKKVLKLKFTSYTFERKPHYSKIMGFKLSVDVVVSWNVEIICDTYIV